MNESGKKDRNINNNNSELQEKEWMSSTSRTVLYNNIIRNGTECKQIAHMETTNIEMFASTTHSLTHSLMIVLSLRVPPLCVCVVVFVCVW